MANHYMSKRFRALFLREANHRQETYILIIFEILCCYQFFKNKKYVRILLNHFSKLINTILPVKEKGFCDGIAFWSLTSLFFLPYFKPKCDLFKILEKVYFYTLKSDI